MATSDQIAFGALIVALLALFISARSYALSKKSYSISKKEHDDKYNEICAYLINSYKWSNDINDFCSFAISYTNQATGANSLKEIYLEIEYYDEGGCFNKAKLSPDLSSLPEGLAGGYQHLNAPMTLNSKETLSGWVSFKLPKLGDVKINVETYRVVAIASANDKSIVEAHIITFFGS